MPPRLLAMAGSTGNHSVAADGRLPQALAATLNALTARWLIPGRRSYGHACHRVIPSGNSWRRQVRAAGLSHESVEASPEFHVNRRRTHKYRVSPSSMRHVPGATARCYSIGSTSRTQRSRPPASKWPGVHLVIVACSTLVDCFHVAYGQSSARRDGLCRRRDTAACRQARGVGVDGPGSSAKHAAHPQWRHLASRGDDPTLRCRRDIIAAAVMP